MAAGPTVALFAIMKNEADAIEEGIAFHILQGVSHAPRIHELTDLARRDAR
jgi:hypothetical protein